MKCYKPKPVLIKQGERIRFLKWTKFMAEYNHQLIQWLPCGNCENCLLKRAKEWGERNYLESLSWQNKWFITLTYNDDNLKWKLGKPQLVRKDVTLFLKKIRNKGQKIKFFGSGELGTKTRRPHYHYIIYGLEINDLEVYKKNKSSYYYTSKWLNEIWGLGNALIADFSTETASYIARYTIKKKNIMEGEFLNQSNGIGKKYYQENKNDIYKYDKIAIKNNKGVYWAKPPRYYDKLYEKEEPDKYLEIKKMRMKNGKDFNDKYWEESDKNWTKMLADEKIIALDNMKKLRRKK